MELEAPASGVLSAVTAQEGDVVPVGHTIAQIAAPTEAASPLSTLGRGQGEGPKGEGPKGEGVKGEGVKGEGVKGEGADTRVKASPLARKIAEEHGVDLTRVKTTSGRIEK